MGAFDDLMPANNASSNSAFGDLVPAKKTVASPRQVAAQPKQDVAEYLLNKLGGAFTGTASNLGSAALIAGGGLANLFGADDTRDALFSQADRTREYWNDYNKQSLPTNDAGQSKTVKVAGAVAEAVPLLAAFAANPVLGAAMMEGGSAGQTFNDVHNGVDTATAEKLLASRTTGNAAMLAIPMSVGKNIIQRTATGAAIAPAQTIATSEADRAILNSGGYKDMASQINPYNAETLVPSALIGALFGAKHGYDLAARDAAEARTFKPAVDQMKQHGDSVVNETVPNPEIQAIQKIIQGEKQGESRQPYDINITDGSGNQARPSGINSALGMRPSISDAEFEAYRPILEANGITSPADPRAFSAVETLKAKANTQVDNGVIPVTSDGVAIAGDNGLMAGAKEAQAQADRAALEPHARANAELTPNAQETLNRTMQANGLSPENVASSFDIAQLRQSRADADLANHDSIAPDYQGGLAAHTGGTVNGEQRAALMYGNEQFSPMKDRAGNQVMNDKGHYYGTLTDADGRVRQAFVDPTKIKEFTSPANPRQAQDYMANSSRPRSGVGEGTMAQEKMPRRSTDRISGDEYGGRATPTSDPYHTAPRDFNGDMRVEPAPQEQQTLKAPRQVDTVDNMARQEPAPENKQAQRLLSAATELRGAAENATSAKEKKQLTLQADKLEAQANRLQPKTEQQTASADTNINAQPQHSNDTVATRTERIDQHRDILKSWIPDMRWQEIGGQGFTDTNDTVGRTHWLAADDTIEYARKGLNVSYRDMQKATQNAIDGKPLGKNQQAIVDGLLDYIDHITSQSNIAEDVNNPERNSSEHDIEIGNALFREHAYETRDFEQDALSSVKDIYDNQSQRQDNNGQAGEARTNSPNGQESASQARSSSNEPTPSDNTQERPQAELQSEGQRGDRPQNGDSIRQPVGEGQSRSGSTVREQPATDDNRVSNTDLLGDNTQSRQAIADAERAKDASRNSGDSNSNDFTLSGSDRPSDVAESRGAQDMFGSTLYSNPFHLMFDPKFWADNAKAAGFAAKKVTDYLTKTLGWDSEDAHWAVKSTKEMAQDFSFSKTANDIEKAKAMGNAFQRFLRVANAEGSNIHDLADRSGSNTFKTIASMLYTKAGEIPTQKIGLEHSIEVEFSKKEKLFAPALDALDKGIKAGKYKSDVFEQVTKLVRNPEGIRKGLNDVHNAADSIRKFFDETLKYLRDAGVDIGEVKSGYYPREFKTDMLVNNPTGFKDALSKAYIDNGMREIDARQLAEETYNHIVIGGDSLFQSSGAKPKAEFLRGRVFSNAVDSPSHPLNKFLVNDPRQSLPYYLQRATRRAELSRFLMDSANMIKNDAQGKTVGRALQNAIDKTKDAAGDSGANWELVRQKLLDDGVYHESIARLEDYVREITGSNNNANPVRSATSWLRTLATMGLLEKATLSSLSEAIMPAIRTGNLLDMHRSMGATLKSLIMKNSNDVKALTDLAEDLGIVGSTMNSMIMANRWNGGHDVSSQVQSKILASNFKMIGLTQWTDATRVASMKIGQIFLRRMSKQVEGGSNLAKRNMQELGMSDSQVKTVADWINSHKTGIPNADELSAAPKEVKDAYARALQIFDYQTIMRPNKSTRPRWANTDIGGLIFQLQAYNYAFFENVWKRGAKNMKEAANFKDGDYTMFERTKLAMPLMMMPLLAAGQYVVGELRDALYGDPDRKKNVQDKVFTALSRGIPIAPIDPLINVYTGAKYNSTAAQIVAGASLGTTAKAIDSAIALKQRNSDKTNSAERTATKNAYDVMFEPMAAVALAYYFEHATPTGKFAVAAARQAIGSNQVRNEAVNAVAGKKHTNTSSARPSLESRRGSGLSDRRGGR